MNDKHEKDIEYAINVIKEHDKLLDDSIIEEVENFNKTMDYVSKKNKEAGVDYPFLNDTNFGLPPKYLNISLEMEKSWLNENKEIVDKKNSDVLNDQLIKEAHKRDKEHFHVALQSLSCGVLLGVSFSVCFFYVIKWW